MHQYKMHIYKIYASIIIIKVQKYTYSKHYQYA